MKKLISVFAVLVLVGAVAAKPAPAKRMTPAQMKAEAAAKAKAEAEAKAKAAAMPAPAPAAKNDSNFQIGLYGGYNIHLATTSGGASVTPTNAGGIYGGADFLYGQAFKFGIGVAYSQTNTTSGATAANLPIVAKIRYYFVPSIFAGINGGYALDMSTAVTGVTNTIIPVGGEIGYALNFGGVGLDIGAQLTYYITSTKVEILGTSTTTAGSAMFVTPYVRVNFQF